MASKSKYLLVFLARRVSGHARRDVTRYQLLESFDTILRGSSSVAKTFVSSRDDVDIVNSVCHGISQAIERIRRGERYIGDS